MQLLPDVAVTMRDGVRLLGDAWTHGERRPTLFIRTALGRDRIAHDFLKPMQGARAGYAVFAQDVRGRFASQGKFSFSARQEADDVSDTIAWLVAQPWSDGQVAMLGGSHAAVASMAAAARGTANLAAISPAMLPLPELDREARGAACFDVGVGVVAYFALAWIDAEVAAGRLDAEEGRRLRGLALDPPSLLERRPARAVLAPLARFLDALPRDGAVPIRPAELDVPALLITGWFDFCAPGMLALYRRARAGRLGAAHQLIIGPWIHDLRLMHYAGDLLFGIDAGAEQAGICEQQLAFFDHHLRGGPQSFPPVRYYMIGENAWRHADAWPPPGVTPRRWHLSSGGAARSASGDGRLSATAVDEQAPDRYRYDPADPVRSHGGTSFAPDGPGPLAQASVEARQDVLCYTSSPFDEALDCVGPVSVELWASTSARDTDFVARLTDVHPDGRSIPMCSGIRHARAHADAARLAEPGAVLCHTISLGDVGWRIRPGHRLRLQITSSDFPHFDRNLNTGGAIGADADGVVAEQTVFHDATRPSCVVLHVVPAGAS